MKTSRIPYLFNRSLLTNEEIVSIAVRGYKEGYTEAVLIKKYNLTHYKNGNDVLDLLSILHKIESYSFMMVSALRNAVHFATHSMVFYEIIKELYDFCIAKNLVFEHKKPIIQYASYKLPDYKGIYYPAIEAKYGNEEEYEYKDLSEYFEGLNKSERAIMLQMTQERWSKINIFDKEQAEQQLELYRQEQKDFMEIEMWSELARKKYLKLGTVAYLLTVVLKLA